MKKLFEKLIRQIVVDKGTLQCKVPHPNQDIFLIWDPYNRKMAISFRFSHGISEPKNLPICKGYESNWNQYEFMNRTFSSLMLWAHYNENNDIFFLIGDDLSKVILDITDENLRLNKLIYQLRRWQKFFEKRNEPVLTKESEMGLWGELHTLLNLLISINPIIALESWQGYNRRNHDFINNVWEVETKCIHASRKDITIHGIHQLEVSEGKDLFLHVIKVERSTVSGVTVNQLIDKILCIIEHDPYLLETFENGLLSYGYPPGGLNSLQSFIAVDEQWYHSKASLPKLSGPEAIKHVEYKLPLFLCTPFEVKFSEILWG